jgi:hypothetical protein
LQKEHLIDRRLTAQAQLRRLRVARSLAFEYHEGIHGFHTASCWENQQGIDV